jgi:glycosyltransferase involved in cell wall biosynthesis
MSEPRISVVVATHDRSARLQALLGSLRAQEGVGPDDLEVIVVDDASSDGTPAVLAAAETRGDLRLRTVRRERSGGPGVARNDGWRLAAAPLVAFTDDDCEPRPQWLAALLGEHAGAPDAILQGPTEPHRDELDRLGPFSRTIAVRRLGPHYPTCNIAYPRTWLERSGGFDASLGWGGEDADLAWRCIEAGAQTRWVPAARVFHAVNDVGPVATLTFGLRWSGLMEVFARHPGMRRDAFVRRIFWKHSHMHLVRALVGLALARRFLPAIVLAVPYVRHAQERLRARNTSALWVPFFLAHDLVELYAVLRGAARHRVMVL